MKEESNQDIKWWIRSVFVPLGVAILGGIGLFYVAVAAISYVFSKNIAPALVLTGALTGILTLLLAVMFLAGIIMLIIQSARKFQHKSTNWSRAIGFTAALPVFLLLGVILSDKLKILNNLPNTHRAGMPGLYQNIFSVTLALICLGLAAFLPRKKSQIISTQVHREETPID